MRKFVIISIFLISTNLIFSQIADIPEGSFKYALINYNVVDLNGDGLGDISVDTNNDGEIQITEAEEVSNLLLEGLEGIISIEGIEYFINLIDLDFSYCNVSHFDLSQNQNLLKLNCSGNPLVNNFDVSNNINLEELYCGNCQLGLLDVSNNINLKHLGFSYNWISVLDLSQNANLITLSCSENNFVTLDVSQTPSLETLYCHNNPLQSLDVSHNPALKTLGCRITQITELDLSQNPDLSWLSCGITYLTELDTSHNPLLFRLLCTYNNQLTSLNIKSGNNMELFNFAAWGNPLLNCIQVDNVEYANAQLENAWTIDPWAEFSEDCGFLGINNSDFVTFEIYPNPVNNYLTIVSDEFIYSIKIYSINGVLVKKPNTSLKIDLSDLSKGIYFIKLNIGGKKKIKKFIKN